MLVVRRASRQFGRDENGRLRLAKIGSSVLDTYKGGVGRYGKMKD
jgi:hypothetical protein